MRAADAAPDARIDGVIVAEMVSGGIETVMGVVSDPVFGPAVMFGLGGVFVEVLKDVTFRLAPFGMDEARRMIEEIQGRAMLDGVRGAPALAAGVDLRPATERNASGDVGEPPLPMSDEPESAGEACERDVVGESAMLA